MYERMLNKQETPSIEEMTKFCGENAERFSFLNEWLVSTFHTEKKIVFPYGNKYGWGIGRTRKSLLIISILVAMLAGYIIELYVKNTMRI